MNKRVTRKVLRVCGALCGTWDLRWPCGEPRTVQTADAHMPSTLRGPGSDQTEGLLAGARSGQLCHLMLLTWQGPWLVREPCARFPPGDDRSDDKTRRKWGLLLGKKPQNSPSGAWHCSGQHCSPGRAQHQPKSREDVALGGRAHSSWVWKRPKDTWSSNANNLDCSRVPESWNIFNPTPNQFTFLFTARTFFKHLGNVTENGFKTRCPFCKAGKKAERSDSLVWRIVMWKAVCFILYETKT